MAVLEVQRVILTVFTLFTLFLHMFRLRIRRHAGKTSEGISPWAGATPSITLATEPCVKVGSPPSSPTQGFARVQIDRRAMRNLLFLGRLLDRQGDREGDAYGDLCISCTLHLPALQVAIEAL